MNSGPTLSIGATGTDVARLQRLFVEMKMLDFNGIDGSFGPVTDQVVHDFQDGAGLVIDGIVGPATWSALPADPDTPVLASGASGPDDGVAQFTDNVPRAGPVCGWVRSISATRAGRAARPCRRQRRCSRARRASRHRVAARPPPPRVTRRRPEPRRSDRGAGTHRV